jgi:hypothetical protein
VKAQGLFRILERTAALTVAALLVFMLSGCGNNLGRLYPDNTQTSKDGKSLSERIAEWENFRLPGLSGDDAAPETAEGEEAALTEEEQAALEAEEAAAAELSGGKSYKDYMISEIMFAKAVNELRAKKHDAAKINNI